MPVFKTKYGEAAYRILAAYTPGSAGMYAALESLCITAEQNGATRAGKEAAARTCQKLHTDEPAGVMCAKCFEQLKEGGRKEVLAPLNDREETVPEEPANEDIEKMLDGLKE